MKSEETENSFQKHYQTLKKIADTLRAQQHEPNVDALIPMIQEATTAYQACKERIACVKTALESYQSQFNPVEDQTNND